MDGERSDTLSTYRHLRLAMALLLALLLVAVGLRALSAPPPGTCFEGSISAYYFTSVRAVFVVALCALGTCLIVYRGNTDAEDIALNASGALAFVVAFVPTRVPSATGVTCSASNVPGDGQLEEAVNNNMWSMIIVSFAAIVIAMLLVARSNRMVREDGGHPSKVPVVGLSVFLVVLVLVTLAFAVWSEGFRANAHNWAAFGTFFGILAVVAINAFDLGVRRSPLGLLKAAGLPLAPNVGAQQDVADGDPPELRRRRHRHVVARRRYAQIWTLMVATMAITSFFYWRVSDWRHGVLWIEAALMIEFLVFWGVQTYELWWETRRHAPPVRG